ncbi:MAG: ComEC/Rec2 family competence protein [Spirochaetota bacterium]
MIYKYATILATGFIAGILLSFTLTLPLSAGAAMIICGLAGAAWIIRSESRWRELPFALSVLSMLLVSVPAGNLRMDLAGAQTVEGTTFHYINVENRYQKEFRLRGTVSAEPELRHFGVIDMQFTITQVYDPDTHKWKEVKPANVLLKIAQAGSSGETYMELADSAAYGYRIEVDADKRYIPMQKNPEAFDYGLYLKQQNMIALFEADATDVTILARQSGSILHEMAFALKTEFLKTYKKTIKSPASRLVAGATLGTRRALDAVTWGSFEIPEAFRRSGVGHVLAVSGLHVSIVSLLLYSILVMAGIRPSRFAPVIIILLVLFTLLTGARPSTVRAAIMNSVTLVAFAYFRYNLRKATFIGLSVSSLAILLVNPHVLFSASFLLSFGAVLSLVLITPTLSRWLDALRGFTLIFFAVYIASLVYIANSHITLFMKLPPLLTMAATLWIIIRIGRFLNDRFPFMWKFAYRAVPFPVRSLIVAQFAIQLGMMIPLNAWFFGQFPVAGILVNLAAIPLIGIIVQLGILTGLAGLIPVVGTSVALPLGAFSNALGTVFLWVADAGASFFNYPATPKPTMLWMACYYTGLALVLSADKLYTSFQSVLYTVNTRFKMYIFRYVPAMVAAGMLVVPALLSALSVVKPHTMVVYHDWKTPVASLSMTDRTAYVFNSGGDYFMERILFSGIRFSRAAAVRGVVLPRYSERSVDAVSSLSGLITVDSLFLPKLYDGKEITTPKNVTIRTINFFNITENAFFSYIGSGENGDEHTSLPVTVTANGIRILLIPDYRNRDLPKADFSGEGPFDVMITPHISTWRDYYYIVDIARKAEPDLLVVTNGEREGTVSALAIPEKLDRDFPVILTNRDGAAVVSFTGSGTTVRTVTSGKSFRLK